MQMGVLVLSNLALWVLTLLLFGAVFLLYRHLGKTVLESPEGRRRQGPQLDAHPPKVKAEFLDAMAIASDVTQTNRLIFFGSATCKSCSTITPDLVALAEQHFRDTGVMVVFRGDAAQGKELRRNLPGSIRIVMDPDFDWATQWQIYSTPFAVLVDRAGIVRRKGPLDSSTTLRSFFVPHVEINVPNNPQRQTLEA